MKTVVSICVSTWSYIYKHNCKIFFFITYLMFSESQNNVSGKGGY
jgi:hypothetical protein